MQIRIIALFYYTREIEAELVTGKTAYLEVEGLHKDAVTFAISPVE